jgi:hypothetical protein
MVFAIPVLNIVALRLKIMLVITMIKVRLVITLGHHSVLQKLNVFHL